MTKAQWKAIYDYCEDNDITTKDLLRELRGAGVMDYNTPLSELGDYPEDKSYDGMKEFLLREL